MNVYERMTCIVPAGGCLADAQCFREPCGLYSGNFAEVSLPPSLRLLVFGLASKIAKCPGFFFILPQWRSHQLTIGMRRPFPRQLEGSTTQKSEVTPTSSEGEGEGRNQGTQHPSFFPLSPMKHPDKHCLHSLRSTKMTSETPRG